MSYIITIIGAGVVSAVTSLILFLINKKNKIIIFELNKKTSIENSKAINNAGTGHSGMCENNYVRILNKKYFIKKNIRIYFKFNLTKNFFSWIKFINIFNLKNTITNIPHISFFFLKKNIKLKKILNKIRFFNKSIKFTNNIKKINKIFPLLIKNKKIKKNYSITYYKNGFDINYQYLSNKIFNFLSKLKFINLYLLFNLIKIKNINNFFSITFFIKKKMKIISDYIFICAGGSSLSILKKYNLNISKNYFEFPVNGTWLICENINQIKKHNLKIYSETLKFNPPMSIPHLDMRNIFKEKKIFFGPFAGITMKILINSNKNILKEINFKFFFNMINFIINNNNIISYLFKENIKTKLKKINNIKNFSNLIKKTYIKKAGKRLQILKKKKKKINLNFGTKLIFNKNKKLVTLLGASPGASISVSIVKKIILNWFNYKKKIFFNYFKNCKQSNIFNYLIYSK